MACRHFYTTYYLVLEFYSIERYFVMTKRKEKAKKPDDKKITILREAKALLRRELLAIPGVHGIGIGYKKTAGKKTSTLAIVVRV